MVTETEQQRTKVCRICWNRLPITLFRHVSREKNTFHPECRDCRRECDRAGRAQERRSGLNRFCRVIGSLKTPDALLKFVDRFCDELRTTPFDLAGEMADYAQADNCSPSQRHKIARSLLHIQATAELAKAQAQPKLDDPEAVIRELHRTHRLFPALREMYLEGKLSFDDIDPSPAPEV